MAARYPIEKGDDGNNHAHAHVNETLHPVTSRLAAAIEALAVLPPDCAQIIVAAIGTVSALRLFCTCKFFRTWMAYLQDITFDSVQNPRQQVSFHGERMAQWMRARDPPELQSIVLAWPNWRGWCPDGPGDRRVGLTCRDNGAYELLLGPHGDRLVERRERYLNRQSGLSYTYLPTLSRLQVLVFENPSEDTGLAFTLALLDCLQDRALPSLRTLVLCRAVSIHQFATLLKLLDEGCPKLRYLDVTRFLHTRNGMSRFYYTLYEGQAREHERLPATALAYKQGVALNSLATSLKVLDLSLCTPPPSFFAGQDSVQPILKLDVLRPPFYADLLTDPLSMRPCMDYLFTHSAKFTSLQALDLSGWGLPRGTEGTTLTLLRGLAELPNLRELELGRCDLMPAFDPDCLTDRVMALRALILRPRLALLDIRGNTTSLRHRTQLLDALAARERARRAVAPSLPATGSDAIRDLDLKLDGAPELHTPWVRAEVCLLFDAAHTVRATGGAPSDDRGSIVFLSRLTSAYADACKTYFQTRPSRRFRCPICYDPDSPVEPDAEAESLMDSDGSLVVDDGTDHVEGRICIPSRRLFCMASRRLALRCGKCRELVCLPAHMSDVPDCDDKEEIRLLWATDLAQQYHGRLDPRAFDSHLPVHRVVSAAQTPLWLEALLQDHRAWDWE